MKRNDFKKNDFKKSNNFEREEKGGYDKLPEDAIAAIQKVIDELN